MTNDRYSMSFTTGSLFHLESVQLAALYLDLNSWTAVRAHVIANNILQARTYNTLQRVCREIVSRLKTLSQTELEFLITATHREQACLLWVAICRRYTFVADFAIEVLRERYVTLKGSVSHADFDRFYNQKSDWHPELGEVTPTTRAKLRQVLFKMLRDADLLSAENNIKAVMPTPRLLQLLNQGDRQQMLYLPMFESDLEGISL